MSSLGHPPATPLAEALAALRAVVAETSYPLVTPDAEDARTARKALLGQLDDYLLPRIDRLDGPLLAVVGGSTGAGKSTLVNSLVEAPVSAAGVLRPTTRAPVLVCHPNDTPWFRRRHLLPGLIRTTSAPGTPDTLQLVSAPALVPGLALLDAPDIDSVVDSNRALAGQLLAAADLWLFVTSAARYADAVPWHLLETAQGRGTAIALVLDRMPPEAADEVGGHFTEMLTAHGFGGAPLFVVPETTVDGQGLLPERAVAATRAWLGELARDAAARAAVVRQTVAGAAAAATQIAEGLAATVDDQVAAAHALTERVRGSYAAAMSEVDAGMRDGTLLRGEVLTRWHEFVGTGPVFAALQERIGRLRDRLAAAVTGRVAREQELQAAIESSLSTLIVGAATQAAEQSAAGWQALPAGAALLRDARVGTVPGHSELVDLGRPSEGLTQRAERLVRDWQRGVLDLVRAEASDKRTTARVAAYAINATGLLVMVGVFASTAFIPTGAEIVVAGGTTVAAQKVLEAIFGDQAIRGLAARAREDLLARVQALLDEDEVRYLDLVASAGLREEPADRIRQAAAAVTEAARLADLAPVETPALATVGQHVRRPAPKPSQPEPEPEPEPEPRSKAKAKAKPKANKSEPAENAEPAEDAGPAENAEPAEDSEVGEVSEGADEPGPVVAAVEEPGRAS